jgi:hypothetical protein
MHKTDELVKCNTIILYIILDSILKSYIVNFSKIDAISAHHIVMGEIQIPIGGQYKSVLLNRLK